MEEEKDLEQSAISYRLFNIPILYKKQKSLMKHLMSQIIQGFRMLHLISVEFYVRSAWRILRWQLNVRIVAIWDIMKLNLKYLI